MIRAREHLRAAGARLVWGAGEDERGFARRVFWTSAAVYALYFNPYLQSSMTANFLDLATSFVSTGRPYLTHIGQYGASDTAWTSWGIASGEPVGPSLLLLPLAAMLRVAVGVREVSFEALNAAAVLGISIPAGGLVAVLTYLQARRFGGDEAWCRSVAWLGAFGTQAFPLSTMYTKELLGTVAGLAAFHLASRVRDQGRGGPLRAVAMVGLVASLTGLMVYPLWLLLPGLVWYLRPHLDRRGLACLLLGAAPAGLLLLAYNSATFGHPFLVGYLTLRDPVGSRWGWPNARILWDLTLGPAGGLFFYHPVLILTPVAFWLGWRRRTFRRDLGYAGATFVACLLVYAAWLVRHYDNNAYVASLGFRMLLPAVPLLVVPLGALTGPWRRLGSCLGIVSILSGAAFATAGLIPGRMLPLTYIAKVSATSLASGLLFADALPRYLGIETLHTTIASHRMAAAALWGSSEFPALVARQVAFRLLSLGLLLGVAAILARVRFGDAAARDGQGSVT